MTGILLKSNRLIHQENRLRHLVKKLKKTLAKVDEIVEEIPLIFRGILKVTLSHVKINVLLRPNLWKHTLVFRRKLKNMCIYLCTTEKWSNEKINQNQIYKDSKRDIMVMVIPVDYLSRKMALRKDIKYKYSRQKRWGWYTYSTTLIIFSLFITNMGNDIQWKVKWNIGRGNK